MKAIPAVPFLLCVCLQAAPPEPIAAWQGEGNTSPEPGGSARTGVSFRVSHEPGVAGQAFSFDGKGGYIETDLDVMPSAYPSMTWSVWIRPDKLDGRRQILTGDDGGYDRSFLIEDGNPAVLTGRACVRFADQPIKAGEWRHFAVVFTRDRISVFSGRRESRLERDALLSDNQFSTRKLTIGGNPTHREYFAGGIDDVRIYGRALTAGEIEAIGAERGPGPGPVAETGKPSYRRFTADIAVPVTVGGREIGTVVIPKGEPVAFAGETGTTVSVWLGGRRDIPKPAGCVSTAVRPTLFPNPAGIPETPLPWDVFPVYQEADRSVRLKTPDVPARSAGGGDPADADGNLRDAPRGSLIPAGTPVRVMRSSASAFVFQALSEDNRVFTVHPGSRSATGHRIAYSESHFRLPRLDGDRLAGLLAAADPRMADYTRAVARTAAPGYRLMTPPDLIRQTEYATARDRYTAGRRTMDDLLFSQHWMATGNLKPEPCHPSLAAPYLVLRFHALNQAVPPITFDGWAGLVRRTCAELGLRGDEKAGYPDEAVFSAIRKHANRPTDIHYFHTPVQNSMDSASVRALNRVFISMEIARRIPVVALAPEGDTAWVIHGISSAFDGIVRTTDPGGLPACRPGDSPFPGRNIPENRIARAYAIGFPDKTVAPNPATALASGVAIRRPANPKPWHVPLNDGAPDFLGLPFQHSDPDLWAAMLITAEQMRQLTDLWTDLVVTPCDRDESAYSGALRAFGPARDAILTSRQKETRRRLLGVGDIPGSQSPWYISRSGHRAPNAGTGSRAVLWYPYLALDEIAGHSAAGRAERQLPGEITPLNRNDDLAQDMSVRRPADPKAWKPWHWPHMYGATYSLGFPKQDKVQYIWGALRLTEAQMTDLLDLWTRAVIRPCESGKGFVEAVDGFAPRRDAILTPVQHETRRKIIAFYAKLNADLGKEGVAAKDLIAKGAERARAGLPAILTELETDGWLRVEAARKAARGASTPDPGRNAR